MVRKETIATTSRRTLSLSAIAIGVLLTGCAVTPQVLTSEEQSALIDQDRRLMAKDLEPINGVITLDEALRRALKYNLDSRLQEMERAVSENQLNLSRYELLPQIALNSGYVNRNNKNLSLSRDEATGKLTTNPFLSQDRELTNASLGLTWSILDFGVSYLQARENANQLLIAQERHRRVVNEIVESVRTAYWRAATAEPLVEKIVPVLQEARAALADTQEAESRRLVPLLQNLQYQKELVEMIRQLDVLEMDLAIAKTELASLMGLPPTTQYKLQLPPKDQMDVPKLGLTVEAMEVLALENRPDLREAHYQQRISADETRKALFSMFPSLTASATAYTDSNSYLVNQNWADTALRLSWDLLNLAKYPASRKAAKSNEELVRARRLALSMAALTQVNVSYQQYLRATSDYEQATLLEDIENRIYTNVNDAANAQGLSQVDRIRAHVSSIYAEVNRFTAYAQVHSAVANLYMSMGMDLTPDVVPGTAAAADGPAPAATSVNQ